MKRVWPLERIEPGSMANLEDLRQALLRRLALVQLLAGGAAVWWSLPRQPLPLIASALWLALFCLGAIVWYASHRLPKGAPHILVWGDLAVLLTGMYLQPADWLPMAGAPIAFVCALLLPRLQVVPALAVIALAGFLDAAGIAAYPIAPLSLFLLASLGAGWITRHTLYTALSWAWGMQQRADSLLESVRRHRAELVNAMRSLQYTNGLLLRTHNELLEARGQADEARRLKERFAANISHELRTPLNLILGFSELMYASPEVYGDMQWPPSLRRDVYQIYRSSRHLLEMIDDVLDLSRFELAGFRLRKEPARLEPLAHEAAEITRDLFRARSVRLEVAVDEDLPEIEMDRTRVRQVLLNLLKNALSFPEVTTVRLAAYRARGEVVVSVSDDGPGIPPDKLGRVFEEFYRSERSQQGDYAGSGLGLAICERFVREHGGHIWAESAPGAGATFYFTLPLPEAPLLTGRKRPDSERLQCDAPKPVVLVLDRDPSVVALLGRYLESYDLVQVADPDRLGDAIEAHQPRAVIVNERPGERIAPPSVSCSVPVIECCLPSRTWLEADLSVAAYLTKPMSSDDLVREMERLERERGPVRDVLVVDDDRGFCQLVERVLAAGDRQLRVRRAYDGAGALDELSRRRPDLVLLDLAMPGMDGLAVLDRVRAELPDLPVILVTARGQLDDMLARYGGCVTISRSGGVSVIEQVRYLEAVLASTPPSLDATGAEPGADHPC